MFGKRSIDPSSTSRLTVLRVFAAFGLGALLSATVVAAQENTAAGKKSVNANWAPSMGLCYGTVTNDDGKKLNGVKLSLVQGVSNDLGNAFTTQVAERQSLETVSVNGTFRIEIPQASSFWRASQNVFLLAQFEAHRTQIVKLNNSRLLTDAPFEIEMDPAASSKISVRDEQGEPVAGAQVCPGQVGDALLPYEFSRTLAEPSDTDGSVVLPGFDRENLQKVYVCGESCGNQLVTVLEKNGTLVATVSAAGKLAGQILCDGEKPELTKPLRFFVGSVNMADVRAVSPRSSSWELVETTDGSFVIDNLAYGSLTYFIPASSEFPFVLAPKSLGKAYEHNAKSTSELKFHFTAAREIVFGFHDERGKPIENLTINGTLRQSGLTDSQGEIPFWVAKGSSLDGQLFHFDPFERYSMEAFGIHLVRQKEESPGQVSPFTIPDTACVHGNVVDEKGNAVVNAKVTGSFSQERFARQKDTYSDRNGSFVLRGIPKNAKVDLSARRDNLLTDANSPIVADAVVDYAKQEPTKILLRQQLTARLTGILVDDQGKPVSGAIVRVHRAQVTQKEGYSSEELFPQLLEDGEQGFRTDAQGRFQTQPVVNFGKRFQIEVQAAGYQRYRSPFRNGARRKRIGGVLDLGEFKLLSQATKLATHILVTGPDGTPLDRAELAVVGAFSGRTFGQTDDQGLAVIELQQSPSLLLVRAEGLPVHMQLLEPGKAELNLTIPAELPGLASLTERVPQLRSIAKQLVDALEQPQAGKSTPYQQLRYFRALATADTKRFVSIMMDHDKKYQAKQTIAMMSTNTLFREVPELCMDAISLLSPSPRIRASVLAGLAQALESSEAREEVLGEAVLAAGELSGEDRLGSSGYVTLSLLLDGRRETAIEFMEEAWGAATELQDMLAESRREHKRGLARVFVPYLALLDVERSLKLIELTADAQEVPALQSQALVLLSLIDFAKATQYAKEHEIDLSLGLSNLLVNNAAQAIGERAELRPWFLELANELKPSTSKLKLLLMAARHMPAGAERLELIRRSAEVWEKAEIDYWYHWTDPCKTALEELPAFEQLTNEELSMLIFAAAKTGPSSFGTHNDMGVFANFARLVAMRDTELGQAILEPAFSGTTWLHHMTRPWLDNNLIVGAAAWSDPDWAMKKVFELSEELGAENDVYRLQLICSLVADIEKILEATR